MRGGVPAHIGERRARVGRVEHGTGVGLATVLAVLVGASEIYGVWNTVWRDHQIVIPALTRTVVDVLGRGEVGKYRHTGGDVIATIEACRWRPRISVTSVHSGL